MYDDIDSNVHVYAPAGADVQLHLDRIKAFNTRVDSPTRWQEDVYTGHDFVDKMIAEKKGNVVVLAGNNLKKTEYVNKSIEAGFHVLADKPMAIDTEGFAVLLKAFESSRSGNKILYDIMTERFEITTILQRELSMLPEVFGTLEKGTPEDPSVTKESVHHFFKNVSGSTLTRPAWFMDVTQEGEGIVDVTTHLVDLVQWECYPDQIIDYKSDVALSSAKRSTTAMTLSQFRAITKLDQFPGYLKKDLTNDSTVKVYCNGEINYRLKDVNAKVSVVWNYKAPEGTGDTHYSMMRGTKTSLIIRQGAEQNYKATLYVEPRDVDPDYPRKLQNALTSIEAKYPGIGLKKVKAGWEVVIPDRYKEGHEAHFGRVMENFLSYIKNNNMPAWEVPNMIAKYYVTTQALELAKKK